MLYIGRLKEHTLTMDKYSNITPHNNGYWNKKTLMFRGRKTIRGTRYETPLKRTARAAAKCLDWILLNAGHKTINGFYTKLKK